LLPGLALIGVVAAPMPPANPPTPPAPTSAGEYSLTLTVAGHTCKTIGWYDRKSPQPPACGPDNRLGFGDNDKVYVATAANQSQPEFEIVASMRGFSPSVYDLKVHTPDGEKVCKGDATANCVITIPAKTDDTKWPGTDIIAALDYKGGDRQRDNDNANSQIIDGGDAGIRLNYKRPNGRRAGVPKSCDAPTTDAAARRAGPRRSSSTTPKRGDNRRWLCRSICKSRQAARRRRN
jgi:hypothetical protein